MDIGPIPGIRVLGAVEAKRRLLDPPAIFEVDGLAKPGDGIVGRTGRKAAGAEEDEDENDLGFDEDNKPAGEAGDKNIDYFA